MIRLSCAQWLLLGACSGLAASGCTEGDVDDSLFDDDAGAADDDADDDDDDDTADGGADDTTDGGADDDVPAPTFDGAFGVVSLGVQQLTDEGVEVSFILPDGAQSFALVVDGSEQPEELMIAEKVTTPSGEVVFDFEEDISINRTDATVGSYTLLVPTNPDVSPEPGKWVISLRTGSEPLEGEVKLVVKMEPAEAKVIDLNLHFVGIEGLTAEDAIDDISFQGILEAVSDIYDSVGITLGEVTYNTIDGDDAETFGVIDSEEELAGLFQTVPSESSQSLNLFLVNDIAFGDAGLSILGLAGGVPGPPTLQGTSTSGVAINMGSYLTAFESGDPDMLVAAGEELEIIIAHESGHFLGLFHTVERNGLGLDGDIVGQDPLSDTPLCPDSADANEDGRLSPAECADDGADNLMFWSPANDSRSLTDQQGEILLRNPVTR